MTVKGMADELERISNKHTSQLEELRQKYDRELRETNLKHQQELQRRVDTTREDMLKEQEQAVIRERERY